MPRKPRKIKQRTYIAFDETIRQFLLTGEKPERDTLAWELYTSRFFDGGAEIEETRAYYRERGFLG